MLDGARPPLVRGDQELSNKKKFIKIGPLLRKLKAKMSFFLLVLALLVLHGIAG